MGRAATSHQQTAYLATSHWSHTPHTPSLLLPVEFLNIDTETLFRKLSHLYQNVAITDYKLQTVETAFKVEAKILNDQSSVVAAKFKGSAVVVEGCSIYVYIEAVYWLPYEASVC